MPEPLSLKAHAKVNLGLNITAKRADGFHELDTLFVRLELHDLLRLEVRDRGVSLSVTGANLPTGASNLAFQAATSYLKKAEQKGGVHIHLNKRIPVAAGLGGGSSDAAAVLRGLAKLYPAKLDLMALALDLGSDVPFFVMNETAARGRGRGEKLESVDIPPLNLVLINPGIHVSAGAAYKRLKTFAGELELESLIRSLPTPQPSYTNSLQAGVVELEPQIQTVLDALSATPLRGVMMSGSGSTCFGLAEDKAQAASVAAQLQAEYPAWWVCSSSTL